LETQLGRPSLKAEVEDALYRDATHTQQDRYVDVVGLGSLIVSIATLAYKIYTDHKKQHGRRPIRRTLVTAIRAKREDAGDLMAAEETIVEIVAAEIVTAAGDDDAGDDE
jgi:hypothetical protein